MKKNMMLSPIMAVILGMTTALTVIPDAGILNTEKLMRQEASLVYLFLGVVFSFALSIRKKRKNNVISGGWAAV